MMKQIMVRGQRVKIYSLDEGRTWSSNPQSIIAYGRRKELWRLELQRSFAEIDERRDLDPENSNECDTTKGPTTANAKNHSHSIVNKVRRARLDTGHTSGQNGSGGYGQSLGRSGEQVGVPDHRQADDTNDLGLREGRTQTA